MAIVLTVSVSMMLLATLSHASRLYFTNDTAALESAWAQYKHDYKKSYQSTEEDRMRFKIFTQNLQIIDARNEAETGTATYGINKFADLSPEEIQKYYMNAVPASNVSETKDTVHYVEPYSGAESFVDWTGIYTTPVKDQGYCGSCWAFSATEQIESDAMRQLGSSYILSVNQMLQCALKGGAPCRGGWTEVGYEYVRREGGLETEEDYPYQDPHMNTCESNARKEVIGVRKYTTIYGEENMAAYVKSTGPLSVCLSATGWEFYHGGIVETCPKYVNHCVQAVGVDDSKVGGFWKVRNSYGPDWGESGYIRLAYGQNTCFITRDPTYTETFFVE